jgi:CubicO group peptidase (beta-lactamase class C family)
VLLVVQKGRVLLHESYGNTGSPEGDPVTAHTLFDLASLTKVLATTPSWMLMSTADPEILDRPLAFWFRESPRDKRKITPRHLLAHSSGLPAWRPYYLFSYGQGSTASPAEKILAEPLQYETGQDSVYSDLGFMLLAAIVESHTGRSLNEFTRERIYEPLGLTDQLMFHPRPDERRIALTRRGDPPGIVNDLNCRAIGGACGHAGLFGTAAGVGCLGNEILLGLKSDESFFDPKVMRVFCTRAGFVEGCTRALGFDTPSEKESSSGSFFSPTSVGHTGFTGTSLWIDPERDLIVVLLTNRVFMGESDLRIKTFRPLLHDSIMHEFRS